MDAIDARKFIADLYDLSIAASTDSTRYNLCGVWLDVKHGAMVATDGHRLHIVKRDLPKVRPGDGSDGLLIHNDAIKALRKSIRTPGAQSLLGAEVSEEGDQIIVNCRGFDIVLHLDEVRYPNWNAVVPPEEGRTAFSFTTDSYGAPLILAPEGCAVPTAARGIYWTQAVDFVTSRMVSTVNASMGGDAEVLCLEVENRTAAIMPLRADLKGFGAPTKEAA